MKKYAAATLLSAGLLLGPVTAATAQEDTGSQESDDDDSGMLGLLGLAGLIGLAGLAGRKRRDDRHDDRYRSQTYAGRGTSTRESMSP